MATPRQVQITFDCEDPERVAAFWAEALGYEHQLGVVAADPTGVGPRVYCQRVPEGKVVKNRVHLDVRFGRGLTRKERNAALEAEGARLEALGAKRVRLLEANDDNEACLVMQDVEGNEFCLD